MLTEALPRSGKRQYDLIAVYINLCERQCIDAYLVGYGDVVGDLQVHSNYTDGMFFIKEMAQNAKDVFGLSYIAITDHTESLKVANGLDEQELLDQSTIVAEINDMTSFKNAVFRILSGAEAHSTYPLDISSNILDKLDVVGAATHSNFSLPIEV